MRGRKFIFLVLISSVLSINILANTLEKDIVEVLNTNPVIQERLKNFRATQQDLNIAESEYYPQLDLRLSAGYNRAGELKTSNGTDDWDHRVAESDYRNYESSLTFTQNLFNGFGTTHKVDFQKAQILASAYKYLEKSNDIAFRMAEVYVGVLKANELVGTARENVQINESIYSKVRDIFEAGLTTDSEVKKIQATLSLARSNLSVQKNNARDAEYRYRRVLGRLPEFHKMQKPVLDITMPESIERAALFAIKNNPSLLVSRYNVKGAEALYKQGKKEFYPKIDLEVSQAFNDNDQLNNGFDQADDRFNARVVLTYNLFRGGADKANTQKHISKVAQEVEVQRDLKRQVVEGLDLSWNAYHMVKEQIKDLRDYSQYSEKTLELYKEEYDLGRRSLLDLLSAQNDVINSRSEIIKAEYDQLFAKYRILDAMGLLVVAINGTADEFTSQVNLQTDAKAQEILDTLPIKLDVDEDKIADNIDLCDNSLKENNIMPYGCKKVLNTALPIEEVAVEEPVVEVVDLDGDKDGVLNVDDQCPNTPLGYNVDEVGCTVSMTIRANFPNDSSVIPAVYNAKIEEFAKFLNENMQYTAKIIGHTSSPGTKQYNQWLSERRAQSIMNALNKKGVDSARMTSEGRGEVEPIMSNMTKEGRAQNRRVEVELIIEDLKQEI